MKTIAITSSLAALVLAGTALATTTAHHSTATKTLVVAMHDPGCHWFLRHGKYSLRASVAGPVRVVNHDEATLKVTSSHGTQRIPVGKGVVVKSGHYVVTMVHQAADDNHLKLTVR